MNDPFIAAIVDRIRTLIAHEPAQSLDVLAATLHSSPDDFRNVVEEREGGISAASLVEVVAGLVREFGVDPQWLLTGRYDPSIHHRALVLAEDRSEDGARAIQYLVREQYHKLRGTTG